MRGPWRVQIKIINSFFSSLFTNIQHFVHQIPTQPTTNQHEQTPNRHPLGSRHHHRHGNTNCPLRDSRPPLELSASPFGGILSHHTHNQPKQPNNHMINHIKNIKGIKGIKSVRKCKSAKKGEAICALTIASGDTNTLEHYARVESLVSRMERIKGEASKRGFRFIKTEWATCVVEDALTLVEKQLGI